MAMSQAYTAGIVIALTGLLGGCATKFQEATPAHWQANDSRYKQLDKESMRLLESIDRSLALLAETKQGAVTINSTPQEMRDREWLSQVTPDGMGIPITIDDWTGHPGRVIDMIAAMTGYVVENIGKAGIDTRNVTVRFVGRPAIDVLRNVAYQMGCDALVDPQSATRKIVVDWTVRRRGACEAQ